MNRAVERSPRLWARLAGAFYLLTIIMGLFAEFQQVGTTVLIASHDLPLIKRMRKRVVVLDPGRLVADIASEVSEFRRSSFEVTHRISIGGALAVEGSETRVWAGRDPGDPVKMKGVPIPAAVIARFRAAA